MAGVRPIAFPTKAEKTGSAAQRGFTMVEMTILVAILGLLVVVATPNLASARQRAQRELCIHNLKRIDAAKASWALIVGMGSEEEPFEEELAPYFADYRTPECPAGGTYTIGWVMDPSTCSLEDLGHASSSDAGVDEVGRSPGGDQPKQPKPKGPKKAN